MAGDLIDPKWMFLKAVLFLVIGVSASGLLLAERPTLQNTLLLVVLVWAFCRAYYFVFYVIERYIDRDYRFSGIGSAIIYLWKRRRHTNG
jgi:hypothetical protein